MVYESYRSFRVLIADVPMCDYFDAVNAHTKRKQPSSNELNHLAHCLTASGSFPLFTWLCEKNPSRKSVDWHTEHVAKPAQPMQCDQFIYRGMTSVLNTDASLPYNHNLFESLIVKNRIKAVLAYSNHSEVPTPPNTHSGNLDRN
ncbi:hypothetical protein CSKR_105541 [Clonorchis sinensis]|uniref:Uncharacterized protein n=1 Tax=Clonorchis sinensis TaxID=79923 RepID=A0A3R7HAE2_CLOSI|nr:hypothetical protein CSKR_105541 [Clonorchis sinensis]